MAATDPDQTDKVRALQYSIPEQLHSYIDMVQPTTRFGSYEPQRSQVLDIERLGRAADRASFNVTACNETITPECLKQLYKIPLKGPKIKDGVDIGFAAFTNYLEQVPRFNDLADFEAEYAPYAEGANFSTESINGGLFDQDYPENSVEANLDVQYLLSIGYPVPIHAYATSGRGPLVPDLDQPNASDSSNEPYLDWLRYVTALPDDELPHTITTSYGKKEPPTRILPFPHPD